LIIHIVFNRKPKTENRKLYNGLAGNAHPAFFWTGYFGLMVEKNSGQRHRGQEEAEKGQARRAELSRGVSC